MSPCSPCRFRTRFTRANWAIDCRYCHNGVEKSWFSNIPAASTCMNCHSQVLKDDPRLAIVRESATNNTPIPWVQVHITPDYVYFNHSVHVTRGISCVECHGRVDQMDEVHHAKPLSMSFCLDCHRDPAAHIRPVDKVTDLGWKWSTNAVKAAEMQASQRRKIRSRLESRIAAKLLGLSPMKTDFETHHLRRNDWPPLLAQSGRTGRHAGVQGLAASRISEGRERIDRRRFAAAFPEDHVRVVRVRGLGMAGAGCRRPEEKLEPFGKQPEDYVYGKPEYFATAMPTRTGAIPLVVKSYEGRPIKIEGNSLFPGSNGGTDRYAQASILNLYDPDRARHFKHDGKTVSREEALKFLDDLSQKFSANQRRRSGVSRGKQHVAVPRAAAKNHRGQISANRNGSLTTRLIPASINARRRRRSASR